MLVLTRRIGESVVVGQDIKITILEISHSQAKLGISAPKSVAVHREEIHKKLIEGGTQDAPSLAKRP